MKFKVGDTVKIVQNDGGPDFDKYIGEVVKISQVRSDDEYILDYSENNNDVWASHEIELVKSFRNNMGILKKLTTRLDRLLNPDLKNIYRVGWVDGDLKITKDGQEALLELLLDKHEKELGKLAGKEIFRLKKNKKYEE